MSESLCPPCVHCRRLKGNRSRGLCWSCISFPEIRRLYPAKLVVSQYANFGGHLTKPQPTAALPGTPEKELVLTGRAERFEELWHPADATGDED